MELTHNNTAFPQPSTKEELRVILRRNPWLKRILAWPLSVRRSIIERDKRSFEAAFERVFSNVVEADIVVAVEELGGEFVMDYRSDLLRRILRTGQYEPSLVEIITRYADPKRDVIDVGANVGLFTVLFANFTAADRRVLAVEPTPNALRLLRRNLARNRCVEKVVVYEGIAAASRCEQKIYVVPGMEEYTSTEEIEHERAKSRPAVEHSVTGKPIDELVAQNKLDPGFIKIDAEGSEFSVIKGARETMNGLKPVLFCEASNKLLTKQQTDTRSLIEYIEGFGYKVYNADTPQHPIRHPFEGEIIAIPTNNKR